MATEALTPERITSPELDGTPHGFFGARAFDARGEGHPLQCGYFAECDPQAVSQDRRLCASAILPHAPLVTPQQVHSAQAIIVDSVEPGTHAPQADAVVTKHPGIVLGVVTADCAPVLLADREAGVIAAAHAGWRGAVDGILESTLAAMEQLGARTERLKAAIGPCIAQASYEVDAPFKARFEPSDERFFVAGREGHWQFDLEGFVADALGRAGVKGVHRLACDTYAAPDHFHSYRRACHEGAQAYGRQLSLIGLQQTA